MGQGTLLIVPMSLLYKPELKCYRKLFETFKVKNLFKKHILDTLALCVIKELIKSIVPEGL